MVVLQGLREAEAMAFKCIYCTIIDISVSLTSTGK